MEANVRPGSMVEQPQHVLLLVQAHLPNLPSALQRIAKYVLENPDLVIHETIAQLGLVTEAGPASIVRFCRALGFSGLREFKLALAADLAMQQPRPAAGESGGARPFTHRLADNVVQATRETQSLLDEAAVERLAAAMASARRIDIYGAATSGFVGHFLAFRLLRIGLPAHPPVDPTYAAYVATGLGADCVAIAISESGMTQDTLTALRTAKAAGAVTGVVTNRRDSPIVKYADEVLLTSVVRSPLTGSKLTVGFTHLIAIETLVAALTMRLGLLELPEGSEE